MNFLKFFIFKCSWIIWRICYKIYVIKYILKSYYLRIIEIISWKIFFINFQFKFRILYKKL